MYYIWNENFDNVYSYEKVGSPICTPMTFNTSRCGLTNKFKIEELDALTSGYKSQESFIEELAKYGDKYIKNSRFKSIVITHKRKGKVFNDDIIYNDLMIHNASKELIRKKNGSSSKDIILIDNSEVLLEFIDYIKQLALNDFAKKFIFDPYHFSGNSKDIMTANYLISDDILDNNGKIIKRGIRSLLSEYVFANCIYKQCLEMDEEINDSLEDIERISTQINYHIRSDYRVLRNLVVWESKFLQVLNDLKENSNNQKEKSSIIKLIEKIKIQKEYRNGLISLDSLEDFYRNNDEIDEECLYSSNISSTIENEELANMYKTGGIEEVMNFYDLDEIYGSQKNYQDAVKLGIIKEKK